MTALSREEMDRIVEHHFACEIACDVDAIIETVSDNIVRRQPGVTDEVLVGKDATLRFYEVLFAALQFQGFDTVHRWYGDNYMVDQSIARAIAVGNHYGVPGNNRPVAFGLLHVFEFEDGLITREDGWPDFAAIRAQLT
jgi:predicted ester cyclase